MNLEIRQDEAFQNREWQVERVGRVLLAVFVAAGLAGLLGAGPLSDTTRTGDRGLVAVSYGSVTHVEADDEISVRLAADAVEQGADQGTATVTLTGSWPSGVDLQGVSPQPSEERITEDGVVYEFTVEDRGEPGDLTVTLSFRAQDLGILDADVVVGADKVSLTQLVLP